MPSDLAESDGRDPGEPANLFPIGGLDFDFIKSHLLDMVRAHDRRALERDKEKWNQFSARIPL